MVCSFDYGLLQIVFYYEHLLCLVCEIVLKIASKYNKCIAGEQAASLENTGRIASPIKPHRA